MLPVSLYSHPSGTPVVPLESFPHRLIEGECPSTLITMASLGTCKVRGQVPFRIVSSRSLVLY